MQSDDFLADRRKGLEESFFAKQNAELLAKLKQNLTVEEKKRSLAAASGISDDRVLDHLLNAQIDAESITALGVVPLLAVAWADGTLDDREKKAVLSACEAEGIAAGSDAYSLLEGWLRQPPSPQLLAAWKDFIAAAKSRLSPEALAGLRDDVIGRAEKIAQTSGGILGISTVSSAEQRVLGELRQAFSH